MKLVGKVWKLLVGVKDGLVLLFMLLFFGALYAGLSASPHADSATEGALHLAFDGAIVEQPAEQDPLSALSGPIATEHRLRDVLHGLEQAAVDDSIKAVALDLDVFAGGGQSALANVGDALARIRQSGKPVIAFATGYSDDTYQLAAHASEVWLDPMGAVFIAGPGGNNLYYAGLLERLGITANVYRVGTYKAAVEPFTRSDMSPESRQANQALAASLWETWVQDVRQARPKAQVLPYAQNPRGFVAQANGDMAQAALRAGLVDRLGDRTAFGNRVRELAGADDEAVPGSFRSVSMDAWIDRHPASATGGQVAVLTVAGNIVDGDAGPGTAAAETIVQNLERGLKDGTFKALVVRVDSPGGSTLASERIRRAVAEVKARGIPVIISFGSVAASGGYWIATAGDQIFAEPSTITGSIGVFGILPSFQGTLERLGVGADGVRTTPLSGEPDLFRGPSPEVSQLLQAGVESTYRRFLSLVSQARRMPVQRVDQIAQGRVWDGGTARQLGLVDRFGSLDEAVAEAARRAQLDPETVSVQWLEEDPGVWATLLRGMSESEQASAPRDALARTAGSPEQLMRRVLADTRAIASGPSIQARCLECPAAAPPRPARPSQASLTEGLLALLWRS